MGYTTTFDGQVSIDPPLNQSEYSFLRDLAGSRRMKRTKGPLYANPGNDYGQVREDDILDYNIPPDDQPGLWLQWVPVDHGRFLEWDGGEKFYYAAEWMKYLIENLLAPSARAYIDQHIDEDPRLKDFTCNHRCDGKIDAQGEDDNDRWRLIVENNTVMTAEAIVRYGKPKPV